MRKEHTDSIDQLTARFPQLASLKGARFLVKYGGAAMEHPGVRDSVCREIAALARIGIEIIVVHGGGKEITRLLERLQIESSFIGGHRVTNPAAMEATEMVLSGAVNKDLASRITRYGSLAVGISGRDGDLLTAARIKGVNGEDLGSTGEVIECNTEAVEALIRSGFIPVISPIAQDIQGQPININADFAAGSLAAATKVLSCVFLTDVPGVKRGGQVIPELTKQEITELIEDGTISGGMIPKVTCVIKALEAGCASAVICEAKREFIVTQAILGESGAGTVVKASPPPTTPSPTTPSPTTPSL
jgi:acetylglutamate kinase